MEMACYESQDMHLTFLALQFFSGTEGKRPNITKDAPTVIIDQKIPSVYKSYEPGTVEEDQIYLRMTKYMYIYKLKYKLFIVLCSFLL